MALKVVGAGLGRTGTHSLQLALSQLLGGPCYHMLEVIGNLEERVPQWMDAMDGNADWDKIMDGYVASVDWPASAYWRELSEKYPDALVLLSTRSSTDAWLKSFHDTIYQVMLRDSASGDSPMPVRMLDLPWPRSCANHSSSTWCRKMFERQGEITPPCGVLN